MSDHLIRQGIHRALVTNHLPLTPEEIISLLELCYSQLPFEIERSLITSLNHLSPDEYSFLAHNYNNQLVQIVGLDMGGWEISVPVDDQLFQAAVSILPPIVGSLMRYAKGIKCQRLILTDEGPELDNFATFKDFPFDDDN